jgi:hypothetical protein
VTTFDPSHPRQQKEQPIRDSETLTALDCTSASECVVADSLGDVFVGNTRARLPAHQPSH